MTFEQRFQNLLRSYGFEPEIDGELLIPAALIVGMLVLCLVSRDIDLFVGAIGAIGWLIVPWLIFRVHARTQDQRLAKMQANYAVGLDALMSGAREIADKQLAAIRRNEAEWKAGDTEDSATQRLAFAVMVSVPSSVAFQVANWAQFGPNGKHVSLLEAWNHIQNSPNDWAWVVGLGVAAVFPYIRDASAIRAKRWAEFYGDRLEAVLKAGRYVATAPQHTGLGLAPEGAGIRELFGLGQPFTKAELRRAWLRLARELHPDRWHNAGDGVRLLKEAALKRVNAARDELAPQAFG